MPRIGLMLVLSLVVFPFAGCTGKLNDPAWATQPYPKHLHAAQIADMHVFRRDTRLEIVNSTPHSFTNFNLWLNQRYVRPVESLRAGQTLSLSLWDFYDEYGDRFNAGGFFRTFDPTPVRLVQIQVADSTDAPPLLGLITIRSEPAPLPTMMR